MIKLMNKKRKQKRNKKNKKESKLKRRKKMSKKHKKKSRKKNYRIKINKVNLKILNSKNQTMIKNKISKIKRIQNRYYKEEALQTKVHMLISQEISNTNHKTMATLNTDNLLINTDHNSKDVIILM